MGLRIKRHFFCRVFQKAIPFHPAMRGPTGDKLNKVGAEGERCDRIITEV